MDAVSEQYKQIQALDIDQREQIISTINRILPPDLPQFDASDLSIMNPDFRSIAISGITSEELHSLVEQMVQKRDKKGPYSARDVKADLSALRYGKRGQDRKMMGTESGGATGTEYYNGGSARLERDSQMMGSRSDSDETLTDSEETITYPVLLEPPRNLTDEDYEREIERESKYVDDLEYNRQGELGRQKAAAGLFRRKQIYAGARARKEEWEKMISIINRTLTQQAAAGTLPPNLPQFDASDLSIMKPDFRSIANSGITSEELDSLVKQMEQKRDKKGPYSARVRKARLGDQWLSRPLSPGRQPALKDNISSWKALQGNTEVKDAQLEGKDGLPQGAVPPPKQNALGLPPGVAGQTRKGQSFSQGLSKMATPVMLPTTRPRREGRSPNQKARGSPRGPQTMMPESEPPPRGAVPPPKQNALGLPPQPRREGRSPKQKAQESPRGPQTMMPEPPPPPYRSLEDQADGQPPPPPAGQADGQSPPPYRSLADQADGQPPSYTPTPGIRVARVTPAQEAVPPPPPPEGQADGQSPPYTPSSGIRTGRVTPIGGGGRVGIRSMKKKNKKKQTNRCKKKKKTNRRKKNKQTRKRKSKHTNKRKPNQTKKYKRLR